MPMYTFNCGKCHEEFTRLVPVDCKDQVTCPHCGSSDLRQLFRRFNYVKITQKYHPECRNSLNWCERQAVWLWEIRQRSGATH